MLNAVCYLIYYLIGMLPTRFGSKPIQHKCQTAALVVRDTFYSRGYGYVGSKVLPLPPSPRIHLFSSLEVLTISTNKLDTFDNPNYFELLDFTDYE